MKREDELTRLGVSEITFFYSIPEELKEHTSNLLVLCIAETIVQEIWHGRGRMFCR